MSVAASLRLIRHRNGLRLQLAEAIRAGDELLEIDLRAELEAEEQLDREAMRDTFLRRQQRRW